MHKNCIGVRVRDFHNIQKVCNAHVYDKMYKTFINTRIRDSHNVQNVCKRAHQGLS